MVAGTVNSVGVQVEDQFKDRLPSGISHRSVLLLRAVDELHRDDVISESTWDDLAGRFDTKQLLDVLTTIGGYRMVSMALNTLGVQLEPGAGRFPASTPRARTN